MKLTLAICASVGLVALVQQAPSLTGQATSDEPRGAVSLCGDTTPFRRCEATDFGSEDIRSNPKWRGSSWAIPNRKHSLDNLWVADGALVMKVTGGASQGSQTVGAEIESIKPDFLYGSYRAMIKTATEPGTVGGFFYYLNDKSEIDVEVLSHDNDRKLVHFTIHESNQGEQTARVFPAGFDPSAAFHEYRFDWTSRGVECYLDGQRVATLTGNTPTKPGKVLLNHWTKSAADWGGGPPLSDALMYVKYIEIYFD